MKTDNTELFEHMPVSKAVINVSDMSGYLPVAWHGREYIWLLFQLCTMDDYDWRDPYCA